MTDRCEFETYPKDKAGKTSIHRFKRCPKFAHGGHFLMLQKFCSEHCPRCRA